MSDFKKIGCGTCPEPTGLIDCDGKPILVGDAVARCSDIPEGGTGSVVSISGTLATGTDIATVTIDGVPTVIKAPTPTPPTPPTEVEVTDTLVDGNPIGTVTVNGVPTVLKETETDVTDFAYNPQTGVLSITYEGEGGTTTKSALIKGQATAFFNGTNPASATIFSYETPPVVDEAALKQNPDYVLVGTDGSTWYWNGTAYVTAPAPAETTEWFLSGSAIDATSNKTSAIYRMRGIAVGTKLTASISAQFSTALYSGYDDYSINKQIFLFRDSRFPNTQPAGFSLSNGGGPGDFYPIFGANPRGGTVSFILGSGLAPADDIAGNGTPAMLYRVNRTGANATPIVNRPLFAWQNYTTTYMRMDVVGRLVLGDNMGQDASAAIQINHSTRGLLPPRQTTAQILAIVNPANGLLVYNTTLNKLCVREGGAWMQVTTTVM